MQNAEALTGERMEEFLKGSEAIEFQGQNRAEVYGWVERVLVAQEYVAQGKKQRGIVRAYIVKVTGLSMPQATRLIRKYREEGVVEAVSYRRRSFPVKYTSQDVARLADSGPSARLAERAGDGANLAARARRIRQGRVCATGKDLGSPFVQSARQRRVTANWRRSGSRHGPQPSASGSGANRIRAGGQVIYASTRCTKAIGTESKGCITSMP